VGDLRVDRRTTSECILRK